MYRGTFPLGLLSAVVLASVSAVHVFAQTDVHAIAEKVDQRYNHMQTLEAQFAETYSGAGMTRTESGTLVLRKPGRMRWDYEQPKGKLFISDGKFLWLYTPADNRAEKMKLKASDDMRAPLAFLLGQLDFQKEFRNLQVKPEGPDMRITAE